MRNKLLLTLSILYISFLTGVSAEQVPESKTAHQFSLVDIGKLTQVERSFLAVAKEHKGVHKYGSLYVIALGPQPSSGYGLQFVRQEQILEQLKIYIKRTFPEPGKSYLDVITFPYIIGKLDLPPYTTLSVLDAVTKKPIFDEETDQLTFKRKQFIKDVYKTWTVKVENGYNRSNSDSVNIVMKKLDGMVLKNLHIKTKQEKSKRIVLIIPQQPYEKGAIYLLQIEHKTGHNTKITILPFEIR
ncbi:MAG: protease complex subunit PrcB family protein [Bacillota bacterium]|nr:protease complex subunit PrcB family protein [Bacillota bacterium]